MIDGLNILLESFDTIFGLWNMRDFCNITFLKRVRDLKFKGKSCTPTWYKNSVLLHNSGFCNSCTPKRCLHISAFPNKCKCTVIQVIQPFHTTATWKVWNFMNTTSLCFAWKKLTFWQYYINSEPCMVYYPKWLK